MCYVPSMGNPKGVPRDFQKLEQRRFLAARLLVRAADTTGARARPRAPRPVVLGFAIGWVVVALRGVRRLAPATTHAGRGPPVGAAASR